MGRSPFCDNIAEGLKRGPWTPEEDQKLLAYIQQHGHGCWRFLPQKAGQLSIHTHNIYTYIQKYYLANGTTMNIHRSSKMWKEL